MPDIVNNFPKRVLIVEDNEPWRRYLSTRLRNDLRLHVIGEVSDGLEAIQQAQELQPDLILIDIGLPTLNGIEAARRIRRVSPASKVLFVSENRSADIAEEALHTGAGGYVVKSEAAGELLPAVKAVLEGKRFVSCSLTDHGLNRPPKQHASDQPYRDNAAAFTHKVAFYADDEHFLDVVARFIGPALKAGNAAVVLATESHRERLLPRLQAYELDMGKAIEEGRYIALDAADEIAQFMLNEMPDPVRFMTLFDNLILQAAKAAKSEHPHLVIFGEGVHLLWAQGNAAAAIQVEKLCNQLGKIHEVDVLCGYSLGSVEIAMDEHIFQQICSEHSAVSSQ